MVRKSIPDHVLTEVLVNSSRRCCICFGLYRRFDEIQGQIAHLDQNNSNNNVDNLAYLCLLCHDKYDSRTSQSKGYTIGEVKHYRNELYEYVEKLRQQKEPTRSHITSFAELARHIWPLLSENGRAFMSFGPNSGAESAAPVRWELELWENAKAEIILPNNRKIQELINKHRDLVPEKYELIFAQMVSHIYAFEKHCENPYFAYSDNQFPDLFAKIIDVTCSQEAEKKDNLGQFENWLLERFRTECLPITDAYLIGSVLRGLFKGADVDVFLLLDNSTASEIRTSGQKLDKVKQDFLLEFGRPLHVIVFSRPETQQYYEFLDNLSRKRRFAQKWSA